MLKKLKSLFVIEEKGAVKSGNGTDPESDFVEPTQRPAKSSGGSSKGDTRTARASGSTRSSVPESTEGKVSDKFLNVLLGAMQKHDLEGFDYLEFKQFLKSLDAVDMDEVTKYQSAFANAKTMGATVDVLEKSAGHYLDVLGEEEKKFAAAVQKRRTQGVAQREDEVKQLESAVQQKEQQIAQLTSDIEKAKQAVVRKKEEITISRTKVEKTKNDFLHTYNLLVQQIQQDVKKIKQYLS